MDTSLLNHLKEKNRDWAARMTSSDPDFFKRLEGQQAPEYLWIGGSDGCVALTCQAAGCSSC
jgi:carbonic anhydrase